jgi:glutamate-ammonia-ligase adenylyltransferase
LTNLERWVHTTSDPSIHLQQMVGMPTLGNFLLTILGASQPVADALIQNPELASLVLEPGENVKVPSRNEMMAEGRRLLASATSFSHSLDRLRYLKQRFTLPLVMNDLSGAWEQETVWTVLSELADTLISLGWELAWKDLRTRRDLPEACPVMVVAFGKLAGHELNYSSDVDLAYAIPDGTDEALERECVRFCESLGRVLSDKMGRGSLYRVDLRLRPYGGAGPIVRSLRSLDAYYRLYAEPWELQALLRSRPIVGPEELMIAWEGIRTSHAFRPRLSEVTLDQMLAMRRRIEEGAGKDDLKRAEGGIRDVEFLTQILQMLHGYAHEDVRAANTMEALRALEKEGIVEHSVGASLRDGYTFLRKLEHRLQLVGDRQTHELPASPAAKESLAKSMGFWKWQELDRALQQKRRTVHTLYRTTLHPEEDSRTDRASVLKTLGASAAQWFDALPESDAFYAGLVENEGSLHRVSKIMAAAPKLVPIFRSSLPLTELLMSGEIEEDADLTDRLDRLPVDASPQQVAEAHLSAYARACARHVLGAGSDLARDLCGIYDALFRHIMRRLDFEVDLIALGSYGTYSLGTRSDADILMLVPTKELHPSAESKAQAFVSFVSALHRLGSPAKLDLRLRPDGGKGLLVRTYDGFRAYDMQGMEMWERFALGHARLVAGSTESMALVRHAATTVPLTPERLSELTRMKKRIETERVRAQHSRRHVKLGYGGLNDIEWLVHLHEMRYPTATHLGEVTDLRSRIRILGATHLLNTIEVEQLLEAFDHLLRVRDGLDLQGSEDEVLPENPNKLDRLAQALGFRDGHDFLRHHTAIIDTVRRLYTESLERLRG